MASGDETDWSLYGTNLLPHSPVSDLVEDTNFDRLVASTMGRGMWTIELPDLQMVETIPTVSEWGVVVMTLLVLTVGTIVFLRRQATCA